MSGHSKWATTKRKKAAVDAKRSASFTKLANAVSVAAKAGNDPITNFQLRLAVDRARAASMPKENIERAIKRGTGELGGAVIEEIIYEGYGPGGIAIMIECLSDNRQRTVSNIRSLFNKYGGSLAEAGSVSYLFEKKGRIIVSRSANQHISLLADKFEELIIESGADDFEADENTAIVYTQVSDLQSVEKYLESAGVKIESSDIIYQPKTEIPINTEKQTSIEKLLNALDDDDDVAEVYTNME